jgi:hypothetical protein
MFFYVKKENNLFYVFARGILFFISDLLFYNRSSVLMTIIIPVCIILLLETTIKSSYFISIIKLLGAHLKHAKSYFFIKEIKQRKLIYCYTFNFDIKVHTCKIKVI